MSINPLDPTRLNLDAPLKAAQKIKEYVDDQKTIPLPDALSATPDLAEIKRVLDQHRAYLETQQSVDVGDMPVADQSAALARLLEEIVEELRRLGMWSGEGGILFQSSPAGMGASLDQKMIKQLFTAAMTGEALGGVTGDFDIVMEVRYETTDHKLQYRLNTFSFANGRLVEVAVKEQVWTDITQAEKCPE